jgi:hypothetical protein
VEQKRLGQQLMPGAAAPQFTIEHACREAKSALTRSEEASTSANEEARGISEYEMKRMGERQGWFADIWEGEPPLYTLY